MNSILFAAAQVAIVVTQGWLLLGGFRYRNSINTCHWKQGVLDAITAYERFAPTEGSRKADEMIQGLVGPLHVARTDFKEAIQRSQERN